jgi:hypothetical protein
MQEIFLFDWLIICKFSNQQEARVGAKNNLQYISPPIKRREILSPLEPQICVCQLTLALTVRNINVSVLKMEEHLKNSKPTRSIVVSRFLERPRISLHSPLFMTHSMRQLINTTICQNGKKQCHVHAMIMKPPLPPPVSTSYISYDYRKTALVY